MFQSKFTIMHNARIWLMWRMWTSWPYLMFYIAGVWANFSVTAKIVRWREANSNCLAWQMLNYTTTDGVLKPQSVPAKPSAFGERVRTTGHNWTEGGHPRHQLNRTPLYSVQNFKVEGECMTFIAYYFYWEYGESVKETSACVHEFLGDVKQKSKFCRYSTV